MTDLAYQLLLDQEPADNSDLPKQSTSSNNNASGKLFLLVCIALVLIVFVFYSFDDIGDALSLACQYETDKPQPAFSNIDELWAAYFHGRPNSTASRFDCAKFFAGDKQTMKLYNDTGRLALEKELNLPMDCGSIRRRVLGSGEVIHVSNSVAFARNVYTSYALQEAFLAFSYHTSNAYCFAMSSNSSAQFMRSLRRMEKCFSNVFVLNETYAFDSKGHFQDVAHFGCLKLLLGQKQWDHVFTLQNDDLLIKTVGELSKISSLFKSASAVAVTGAQNYRYDFRKSWSPKWLHLWRNETGKSEEQLQRNLTVTKSLNEVLLSRTFVQSIFDNFNLDDILKAFNSKEYYGVDEMLTSTLFSNGWLGVAGQMRSNCTPPGVVRWTVWNFGGNGWLSDHDCRSHRRIHGICILGVEYLKEISSKFEIIANKVKADFDFGVVMCVGELLQNVTSGNVKREIDSKRYLKLPQILEQQQKDVKCRR